MNDAKYLGRKMQLAGREMVVPSLSVKKIRSLFADDARLKLMASAHELPPMEQIDALLDICASALGRNYPEVDAGWLEENLGPGELNALVLAVLQESQLLQVPETEGGKGPAR